MSTRGLIDERNKVLWDLLNLTSTIIVGEHDKPYYEVIHYDSHHIILVENGKRCPASFTHELLHIYIRRKGISIGEHISKHIKGKVNISEHLSKSLLDHLCNTLDHIKMLPLYLDLGYERDLFISDYHKNKLDKKAIRSLVQHFTPQSSLWGYAFDEFIGKYFAAIACPNESYDYSERLAQMNKLSPDLFAILDRFTNRWKEFDYEGRSNNSEVCELMVSIFLGEIESWAKGQILIQPKTTL